MVDLVRVREERGLTAKDLSAMTGVSASVISLFETQKRGISVRSAKRIAKTLGFNWMWFFEDSIRFPMNAETPPDGGA